MFIIRIVAGLLGSLALIFFTFDLNAQTYRITFRDKPSFRLADSSCYLSQRSLDRRSKQHISVDLSDAPPEQKYLQAIKQKNIPVKGISKWLNTVWAELNPEQITELKSYPFIKSIEPVIPLKRIEAGNSEQSSMAYGEAGPAIRQLELNYLHQNNYFGAGMLIAVFDNGFFRLNRLNAFKHLFDDGQIVAVQDFAENDTSLYDTGTHGTNVISLMNAYEPDFFLGAAYMSRYLLLRTEVSAYERPSEEQNWIMAAEWADSVGADIFQTSLNYNTFDDPKFNHRISDLNGRTAPMSMAAGMAARKGILSVHSAGNEGRSSWRYITVPADADSILAVGGTDINGNIAPFSSVGPAADGRIKPDVVACGQNIPIISTDGPVRTGNGTSFASPLIASMAACLWQAVPKASAMNVRQAILRSADRFNNPDNAYGFGLPNGRKALAYLYNSTSRNDVKPGVKVSVSPNPAAGYISISIKGADSSAWQINLYDLSGKQIYRGSIPELGPEREYYLWKDENLDIKPGIFLLTLTDSEGNIKHQAKIFWAE